MLWTLLAIFIPNAIGIILYFILRDPVPVPCPSLRDAGQEGPRLLRGLRDGGAGGLSAVPPAGGAGLAELRPLRRRAHGAEPATDGRAVRRARRSLRRHGRATREDPLEERQGAAHAAGADEEVPERARTSSSRRRRRRGGAGRRGRGFVARSAEDRAPAVEVAVGPPVAGLELRPASCRAGRKTACRVS